MYIRYLYFAIITNIIIVHKIYMSFMNRQYCIHYLQKNAILNIRSKICIVFVLILEGIFFTDSPRYKKIPKMGITQIANRSEKRIFVSANSQR